MKKNKGFTLIEILLVIAIIAIVATVVAVALDPLTRFQDSRDAVRWNDITTLMAAIKIDQIDNGGDYLSAISNMTAGEVYMIVNGGAMTIGCNDNNTNCDVNVSSSSSCVNLAPLVTEGYLGKVPVSPAGAVTWDDGDTSGEEGTGYTLQRDSTGILHVRSCESENSNPISVSE